MTNTVADPRAVAAMETVSGRRADDKLPFTRAILMKQNEGRLVQVDPFPVSA